MRGREFYPHFSSNAQVVTLIIYDSAFKQLRVVNYMVVQICITNLSQDIFLKFSFVACRYNLEKVFIYSCDNFHGLCICCFVRSYVDDKLYVRNFYCFHFNISGMSIKFHVIMLIICVFKRKFYSFFILSSSSFHLFRTLKKKKMESWSLNLLEDSNFIDVTACANEEVNTVKHRIQTCNEFVVKKQKLVFGGRELSRNNSLV
ncbi:putative 1-phosphatidylinositol 4-kinase [Helianthus annuus]|nr:putative 1-phosphatidylinositol 4-kinase [Helianthus annuus]